MVYYIEVLEGFCRLVDFANQFHSTRAVFVLGTPLTPPLPSTHAYTNFITH